MTVHRRCLFVILWSFLVAMPAISQEEETASDIPEITEYVETVVTSRKREEKVQKVPIAITTFSKKEIEDAGIDTVHDFVGLTSNMSIIDAQNPGNYTLTVRGITKVRNGDAPVAVMIDGVYQASPNALTRDLYDIERIEVLKGPQGALYGRNALGGVISIITREPTYEREGYVHANVGDGAQKGLSFGFSGPLSERAFYRVSGSYQDRDGWIDSATLEDEIDPRRDESLAAKLMFIPNDALDISINLSATDTEDGGPYYLSLADDLADTEPGDPFPNLVPLGEREVRDASIKMDYQSEAGTFTAVVAHSQLDEFFSADFDFSSVNILKAEETLEFDATSLELRFTSPDDRRFTWIAGAFYQDWERSVDTIISIDFDQDTNFDAQIPLLEDNDNNSSAGFAQFAYDVRDNFEVGVAFRYDRDEREQTNVSTGLVRSDTFDAFQSKLSLTWYPDDRTMAYFSAADGFRSGGFNAPGTAAFPDQYDEEITRTFELGFKLDRMDRRLVLNGAVFFTEFEDQQVFVFDVPAGQSGIFNIDESTIQGAELELRAKPAESLELLASVGLTDTEIDSLGHTSPFFDLIEGPVEGNKTPNAPEHSFNLALRHQFPVGENLSFVSRVDYERLGKLYWHVDNHDQRSAQNLLDARIGVRAESWSVTAFIENATDERYFEEFFANEFTGAATDIGYPSRPRSFGIEARKRF
ncbi:TonB-dependent receptor [Sulfidibacter corallicola]|uniref:TonB-dependent receptor n=1 Tax=Sulfidibacter corallicola TaxID=2818388 RepID=A0A8A4TL20_SULCO|nr:TonB-dependent receptor [Sulfidibacter corallicola]QTD50273.1 TonB-dependent receptor [Sulfidibacter corallicola]